MLALGCVLLAALWAAGPASAASRGFKLHNLSTHGGVQYPANLWYKIGGTDASVEYTIETWSTSNESACKVIDSKQFTCTAEGTKLTFKHH